MAAFHASEGDEESKGGVCPVRPVPVSRELRASFLFRCLEFGTVLNWLLALTTQSWHWSERGYLSPFDDGWRLPKLDSRVFVVWVP